MENGLPSNFLMNLSDKQVDVLYKKYITEQPQPEVVSKTVKQIVLPSGSQTTVGGVSVSNTSGKVTVTPTTEEVKEDDQTDYDLDKSSQVDPYEDPNPESNEKGPSQYGVNPEADKSMNDGMGISENKKKSKYNPWAICTSSVGREDKKKYERCVMDVKKSIKEGKNPYQSLVEAALGKMVEKHISPRMTKKDLVKNLSEQGIIRRPMTNMAIGFKDSMDKPSKKTYTSDMNEQGTKTAPPVVKPGTKEKPKTSDPFKNPKHQPKPKALDKPAKKMGTVEIPDYLTFDQLKINFKDQ